MLSLLPLLVILNKVVRIVCEEGQCAAFEVCLN